MFEFFANIFGYLLSFIYSLVSNYGIAIIVFTITMKLILLPLSIKQQKTLKQSTKLQEKMKILQFKYKNDQEKLNQEVMKMYKEERINPFSGCVTALVQMLLLLSIFYLVKSPLTYMQKVPEENIETYQTQLEENDMGTDSIYKELDLINQYSWLKEQNPEDTEVDKLNLDMNFLGLDLNKVPQQNMTDFTVYIIPILYIISSFFSMKITTALQNNNKKKNQKLIIDGSTGKPEENPEEEVDTMAQTNKMMTWMMPIMSISIAFVAPLGLALYWLVNNVLMIIERLVMNKLMNREEE